MNDVAIAPPRAPLHFVEGRQTITPSAAQEILDLHNFVYMVGEGEERGQREAREYHVRSLALEMLQNRFTPGMQIHFARLGERHFLVDGQHRLLAAVRAGRAVEFSILITPVATIEDVKVLYMRHDTLQAKRTIADIVRATGVDAAKGFSDTEARHVLAAVHTIDLGFRSAAGNPDADALRATQTKLDNARHWWAPARLYIDAIAGAGDAMHKRLLTSHIMPVGLATLRFQRDRAEPFWRDLASDDGLRQRDPRKILLEWLRGSKGNTAPLDRAKAAAQAWNAAFRGETLSFIRIARRSRVIILGTPFDGRPSR